MPIAGGILVAGSAARCLSSAAGMLRFLARLSGRRRHVRRSCGPGGGCCATVQSFERTAPGAAGSSGSVGSGSEVVAGTTTTMTTTAMSSVHHRQNRRRDWERSSSGTIQDPRWIEDAYVPSRVGSPEYERLFATGEDERQTRTQSRQVRQLRQERSRAPSSVPMDHQIRENGQECSRLSAERAVDGQPDFFSIPNSSERLSPERDEDDHQELRRVRENSDRLSPDDFAECKLHRVEEIRDNQRLSRRQRLHRTSRCCGSTTATGSSATGRPEPSSRTETAAEWETSPDYVDLIVRGHHHHVDDDSERGTARHQRDNAATAFSGSSARRRSRIPPYLATLLIISYTLFGIADACSSRSTPKPRPPTPTPRPNITFHMYTCPPDYAEWYCLNGATCFTVKIQESLLYNCLCANGFIGQRCEFKDLDGSYLPSRQRVMLETASIAGGATIAVFLVVIICIAAYIHCKRKQKEIRTSSTCVDTVDGPGRDPELRPFSNRSRSLMIFMAKNPNGSTMCPSIEQTRMPGWNDYSQMESARMASVNEAKRGSSH